MTSQPCQVPGYRQSYVEKDRCVRNSTAVQVPGVDVMQGFTMSKTEFENIFLQTAENMDDPKRLTHNSHLTRKSSVAAIDRQPLSQMSSHKPGSRFARQRKPPTQSHGRYKKSNTARLDGSERSDSNASNDYPNAQSPQQQRPFRSPSSKKIDPVVNTPEDAADYADVCRKHAASLQRSLPADYDGAGEFFEKAVDFRAKFGLYCTSDNADAHVEYAQNLSKRGLTPEAEYHLRSAADIYRMLDARSARKYGDVLLYMAVVIDRQGRLAEAENFYRSSLAVYRANKLSDDNVRVAIDSLSNNLRAQGRSEEVDVVVRRHFLGALD